jgi:hypothetical protein
MPRLTLQFEDRVVKEYSLGPMVTIGRLSDNTIVIDNPAASSHHACVFLEGDQFVVEDLQSTNGTFVNQARVSRHVLQQGDVLRVGKHTLTFDRLAVADAAASTAAEPSTSKQRETVFMNASERAVLAKLLDEPDARKHQALVGRLMDVEADATRGGNTTTESAGVGVLRVLEGAADRTEYTLDRQTSLIGKSKSSLVRLRGWFKPQMVLAITRNRQGYVATWLGGKPLVNNEPLRGRHELKDGDRLGVSGLTLEFRSKA